MERLTHEADFGVEDWEQILYRVPADTEGAYNILISLRGGCTMMMQTADVSYKI